VSRMDADKRERRPRRSFSDEFKAGAVRLVLDEGKTISDSAVGVTTFMTTPGLTLSMRATQLGVLRVTTLLRDIRWCAHRIPTVNHPGQEYCTIIWR